MSVWVVYLSEYGCSSPEDVKIYASEADAKKEFDAIFDDLALTSGENITLENPNYAYTDQIHLFMFKYEIKGDNVAKC